MRKVIGGIAILTLRAQPTNTIRQPPLVLSATGCHKYWLDVCCGGGCNPVIRVYPFWPARKDT